MPGISQLRPAADGGPLRGGAPRVVWQSLDGDPHTVSARSAAERLIELGRASHLVWNPLACEIVQLIPIVRAACGLGSPAGLVHVGRPGAEEAGTIPAPAELAATASGAGCPASVNAEGRLCVQIAVVAYAQEPFTSGSLSGLESIMDWLDSWLIPRSWPAGRPAAFPHGVTAQRSRRLWAQGGHFGASQVPDSSAVGPGAVDIERLTGAAARPAAAAARPGHRLDDLDEIFADRPGVRAPLSRAS
jgi:hypothetical protein